MIPLSEISARAKQFGVPADTIEKDYAISWMLICLSKCKLSKDFCFYGGTAIKRMYFDEHRFSEDIPETNDISGFIATLFFVRSNKKITVIVNYCFYFFIRAGEKEQARNPKYGSLQVY